MVYDIVWIMLRPYFDNSKTIFAISISHILLKSTLNDHPGSTNISPKYFNIMFNHLDYMGALLDDKRVIS